MLIHEKGAFSSSYRHPHDSGHDPLIERWDHQIQLPDGLQLLHRVGIVEQGPAHFLQHGGTASATTLEEVEPDRPDPVQPRVREPREVGSVTS